MDCIGCGSCAYVCPAHIPLVQYYRYAKTESWAREQLTSDQAQWIEQTTNDSLSTVLAEFAKIRAIQEHLVDAAKREGVPLVDPDGLGELTQSIVDEIVLATKADPDVAD